MELTPGNISRFAGDALGGVDLRDRNSVASAVEARELFSNPDLAALDTGMMNLSELRGLKGIGAIQAAIAPSGVYLPNRTEKLLG